MKKLIKIIDILFWFIIVINTFIELYNNGLNNISITEFTNINFKEISLVQYISSILYLLLFFLFSIIVSIIQMSDLSKMYFVYLGIKIAIKQYNRERIEKIDLKNDNYYRDLIPKYSISVLSYLDNFKIDRKDIVATLLILEIKRKINIQDKNIIVIDEKTENLEDDEMYVLNNIKNKTLKDIDILEFTKIVRECALKKGVVEEKQNLKKNIKRKIFINALVFILALLVVFNPNILMWENAYDIVNILSLVLLMIFVALMLFMPISTFFYISKYILLNSSDPYIRNKKGKKINEKLEGLRKYLVDFSKIEEKSKDELMLWKEYLVYSVILGINTKIVNELYN